MAPRCSASSAGPDVRSPMVRRAAGVVVLVLCALYAVLPPARGQERSVDQVINRETVLWMWRRTRWGPAAALAAAAALVRELAAGLVAGGLLAAQVLRRPRWPWLAAAGAVVAGLALHSVLASSHLVAHGSEIALLGTGGPDRVATMMGVGLRHPLILGPLVWVLAVGRLALDRELRLLFLFYLTLPLTGFLVGRDSWGFVVL